MAGGTGAGLSGEDGVAADGIPFRQAREELLKSFAFGGLAL
jgi:hypothetical protein